MTITILCPTCLAPSEYATAPLRACPRCGAALPASIESSAAAALDAQAASVPTPLGVRILPWYFALGVLVAVMLLLPSDSYSIDGVPVTRAAFLAATAPSTVPLGIGSAVLSWAFWTDRAWARPALIVGLLVAFLGSVVTNARAGAGAAALAIGAITPALMIAPVWWYLYRRPNVAAYFRHLQAARRPAATG